MIAEFHRREAERASRLRGKVFAPAPAVKNPDGIGYSQLPFHIVWESDMPVQIPGLTNGIEDLMKLFVTLPIIPAYGGTGRDVAGAGYRQRH